MKISLKPFWALFAFCAFLTACENDSFGPVPDDLLRCWEGKEIVDGRTTFLHCGDASLGIAFYRPAYHFKKNGICTYLVLDPADAHYEEVGSYEYLDSENEVEVFDKSGNLLLHFKIIELSSEKMIVQEIQ